MASIPLDVQLELARLAEDGDRAVIGPRDSRVQVIETRRFPWNTVVYLCRDFGSGQCSGCSGTLIAPRLVLTAGHCLYSLKRRAAPAQIYVIPARRDRATKPFGSFRAHHWYLPRGFLQGPNRLENDWGLIVLERPVSSLRQFIPLWAASDANLARISAQGTITVAGYPSDRPLGTMWRHTESLRQVTPRRLLHTVDTCPGHSGSAIWTRTPAGLRIIGVHTAGVLDERGRSYGCKRGAVLAPPGARNSGVRLTATIKEAIGNPEGARTGPARLMRFP